MDTVTTATSQSEEIFCMDGWTSIETATLQVTLKDHNCVTTFLCPLSTSAMQVTKTPPIFMFHFFGIKAKEKIIYKMVNCDLNEMEDADVKIQHRN